MPRISVPGLVDILHTDDPHEIAALATDTRLDRRYDNRSVLFNGFLLGRVRRVLQDGGAPFPTVAPRDDAGRRHWQKTLEARLTPSASALAAGPPDLAGLANQIRGVGRRSNPALMAQEVVGRLFVTDFQASAETWDAAQVLDQAPRSFNLPLLLWWALTGRVRRARHLLSNALGGDRAGIHATGIAIHNIVAGLAVMRATWLDAAARHRLSPEAAAARALMAPDHILRQPTEAGSTAAGDFTPATVVILDLKAARARSPDRGTIFMTGSWSRCPAHAWVPALFEGIWRAAQRADAAEGRP